MKSRRAPIVLLSILFVLAGVAAIYTLTSGANKPPVATGDSPLGDPGKSDPEELHRELKRDTDKRLGLQTPGPDSGPSIHVPQQVRTYSKPKPNMRGQITSLRPGSSQS